MNNTATMTNSFSALILLLLLLASNDIASSSSSSELDAKSIDMARRIIQKVKDYSNNNNVEQPSSSPPPSSSSWQILLRVLEKSFLGNGVEVEEDDNDNNYSSTPHEANARIKALQWLTLDYEESTSSSAKSRHHHKVPEYYESGLLDRYALATIYYATNGEDWTYDTNDDGTQFLSPISHLQWAGVNGNNHDGHVSMLDLSHRNLVSSTFLPLEIVLLSPKLELLWLSDNSGLSGSLPTYIGDLTSLSSLSIYQTSMSGTLPESLYNLPKLSSLRIYKSKFSGGISSNIGKLSGALRWLWIHENQFNGRLPEELGSLSKLEGMTLHGNQLDVVDDRNDGNVGDGGGGSGDGFKSNIIPWSVCTNLISGGELKHLWTDCQEDALLLDDEEGESKLNASVKACSCCTRCFLRKTKRTKNENERTPLSFADGMASDVSVN
ncbi:hypothetical protein ACHAXH_004649 [Discostella pseudostelligera]